MQSLNTTNMSVTLAEKTTFGLTTGKSACLYMFVDFFSDEF